MKYSDTVGNLFELPKDKYVFAHCIAADLDWSGGIAPILIRKEFDSEEDCRYIEDGGNVIDNFKPGDIFPVFSKKGIFVNLITKWLTTDKPTYLDLSESLDNLKNFMVEKDFKYLAMPRIGSGIDGLDWKTVEGMIQEIFKDTDITIAIKHFE